MDVLAWDEEMSRQLYRLRLKQKKNVKYLNLYQGLEGGSWSRIPAPFSRESRILHVFHQFPESRFSFPEK